MPESTQTPVNGEKWIIVSILFIFYNESIYYCMLFHFVIYFQQRY